MEALISSFKTLLTKKDHYLTHLPYILTCILLHNTAENPMVSSQLRKYIYIYIYLRLHGRFWHML